MPKIAVSVKSTEAAISCAYILCSILFAYDFYALFTEPKSDILCFTASLIYFTFKFRVSR